MKKIISLIGATLTGLTMACTDPEPVHYPATPGAVVWALKNSDLPVEKSEIDMCYTLNAVVEKFDRKHKMLMYVWNVGDAEVKSVEKVVDPYKTVLGHFKLNTLRLESFDIGANGLDTKTYFLAVCKDDKKDKKGEDKVEISSNTLKMYVGDDEFVGDEVHRFNGEELPVSNVILFSEAGLQQVQNTYTQELEKIMESIPGER